MCRPDVHLSKTVSFSSPTIRSKTFWQLLDSLVPHNGIEIGDWARFVSSLGLFWIVQVSFDWCWFVFMDLHRNPNSFLHTSLWRFWSSNVSPQLCEASSLFLPLKKPHTVGVKRLEIRSVKGWCVGNYWKNMTRPGSLKNCMEIVRCQSTWWIYLRFIASWFFPGKWPTRMSDIKVLQVKNNSRKRDV